MKPLEGINTEAWLQRCVEKTEAAPVDTQTRGTLLFALSMFGGLVQGYLVLRVFQNIDLLKVNPQAGTYKKTDYERF